MNVAVLSDTHMPNRGRDLPVQAWEIVASSDAVVHAGDVVTADLLVDLASVCPSHTMYAVRGNNDGAIAEPLPDRLEVDIAGVPVAVVHDSGPSIGRRARMRRWFPTARVVVFGHSHMPLIDDDGDLMLLNPGSPTERRRMPTHTMAVLTISNGVPTAELVHLD